VSWYPCTTRVVLDGQERTCLVAGPHQVHRYRDGQGRVHRYEFVLPALYRPDDATTESWPRHTPRLAGSRRSGDLRVYDGERWLKPSWHVPTRAVVYEDEHVVVLKKLPS